MRKHAFMHRAVSFAGLRGVNPQRVCPLLHDRFSSDYIQPFFLSLIRFSKNGSFAIINITRRGANEVQCCHFDGLNHLHTPFLVIQVGRIYTNKIFFFFSVVCYLFHTVKHHHESWAKPLSCAIIFSFF